MNFFKQCPDYKAGCAKTCQHEPECSVEISVVPAHPVCGEWNHDISKAPRDGTVLFAKLTGGYLDLIFWGDSLSQSTSIFKDGCWIGLRKHRIRDDDIIAFAEVNEEE